MIAFDAAMISSAHDDMFRAQKLHAETRAVHAAGFWTPDGGLLHVREDVGAGQGSDRRRCGPPGRGKKRGVTIDLGYAYLSLPDGSIAGFVDVPGHEKFIHNMLAGATGIDWFFWSSPPMTA